MIRLIGFKTQILLLLFLFQGRMVFFGTFIVVVIVLVVYTMMRVGYGGGGGGAIPFNGWIGIEIFEQSEFIVRH